MKLTDAFAQRLIGLGVKHVFGLQGGAVVHIFDSLEQAGVGVTYAHHEQSAALAAVAYAKATENIACVVVTTGPGATNAITGLLAAWQDSIPCIFVSGQARSQHTSYGRKVRQVGTQEVNIADIVRPITKHVAFVRSAEEFLDEFDRAATIARTGRPGPVWLDVPLDIQWADVVVEPPVLAPSQSVTEEGDFANSLDFFTSEKPLLVLGYGLRLAGAVESAKRLVESTGLPFVTTWTASDIFPSNHPQNLGIIGMSGQRGANKAMFSCSSMICLGTHLSIPHTTTLFDSYAPDARKLIVNIDPDQLDNLNVKFDLKLCADLNHYLHWILNKNIKGNAWPNAAEFKSMNWYEPALTGQPDANRFVRRLTQKTEEQFCLVVDGGGTALYAGFQSSQLKGGDRVICSSAISAMGTGLAETVGVAMSNRYARLFCVIGDGSFLMNVQDLQSLRQYGANVIVAVINNNGYLAIRHTQRDFLQGRYYGTHPQWQLPMPSIEKIASAFGFDYVRLDREDQLEAITDELVGRRGPLICEVVVSEHQNVLFKQGYKANTDGTFSPQPLIDMAWGPN